jgi:hypothetical protein
VNLQNAWCNDKNSHEFSLSRTRWKTRQAVYIQCNNDGCLLKHCWIGKAVSIKCYECVSVFLHANHTLSAPYYVVVSGPSGCTTLKTVLHIKCVFWFSLHPLSETFLNLRIQQGKIIDVHWSLCKVPVILVRF